MQYLIYGLVGYILLQCIIYIAWFGKFYQLTLRYPQYSFKNAETIPKYLLEFSHAHTKQLSNLGFGFCKYLEIETTLLEDKCFSLLFYNRDWHTYALAKISAIYNSNSPIDFIFETFFDDGVLLLTIDGSHNSVIGELPATILQEPSVATVAQQWQIHQAKIAALAKDKIPKLLSPESFIEAIASHEAAYINSLYVNKKIVKQAKNDLFNLTVNMAWQSACKCQHQTHPIDNLIALKTNLKSFDTSPKVAIPIQLEVDLFKKWQIIENSTANNNHPLIKIGILLTSLALFILATNLYFDRRSLWLLIGILFFHELGHFTTMKIYKYRNTSIFFLPFFGAAVSGKKDDATLTQQVIVLLSGAVPGIALGLFLTLIIPHRLYAIPNSSLMVNWLIGINCLNLLPVFPLDGGKIINLLLFSTHPYGEVIFKIFTIILLAIASILLKEPILIGISILLIISIPQNWKIARILKRLPSPTKSRYKTDKRLSDIFQAIALAKYQNLQFDTKYRLVKEILQRDRQPSANWRNRLCLITIYLACLIGGIWAMKIA